MHIRDWNFNFNTKKDRYIKEIQKKERRSFRKTFGQKRTDKLTFRLKINKEGDIYTAIHSDKRKQRHKFYRHVKRIDLTWLNKKLLSFLKVYIRQKLKPWKRVCSNRRPWLYQSQVVKIEGNSNKVLGIGIVHHLICQKLPLFKIKLSLWLQDHPFSSEAEILYWWTRQTHPNFLSNFTL